MAIICEYCNFKLETKATTDCIKNKEAKEAGWKIMKDGKNWRRFCCSDCKEDYIYDFNHIH